MTKMTRYLMHNKIRLLLVLLLCLGAMVFYLIFLAKQAPDTIVDRPLSTAEIQKAGKAAQKLTDGLAVPDFSAYKDVVDKKKAFFNYLLPVIKRQNKLVWEERKQVLALHSSLLTGQDLLLKEQRWLNHLRLKYRVAQALGNEAAVNELLKRVDIIPAELILVQAANESGWGSSRFALQGYNFFGLWCFKKGCGFVPKRRNEGTLHEVAKFANLSLAVKAYLHNLNRHFAYAELREIRYQQRQAGQTVTAQALVQGLKRYSERGEAYIEELLSMMRVNRKHMEI